MRALTGDGCLYDSGLRHGDRIDQVDGVSVNTAAAATKLLKQKSAPFELLVTRPPAVTLMPVIETSLYKESAGAALCVELAPTAGAVCVSQLTPELASAGIEVGDHVILLGSEFPSSLPVAQRLWAEAPVGPLSFIVERPAPRA